MDLVRDVVHRFEVTLGMLFDPKKAQLTCTSGQAAETLAKLLGKRAGKLTNRTVKLGIDTAILRKTRKKWTP